VVVEDVIKVRKYSILYGWSTILKFIPGVVPLRDWRAMVSSILVVSIYLADVDSVSEGWCIAFMRGEFLAEVYVLREL